MRRPRPRFTVRRIMIVVAVAGLAMRLPTLGGSILRAREVERARIAGIALVAGCVAAIAAARARAALAPPPGRARPTGRAARLGVLCHSLLVSALIVAASGLTYVVAADRLAVWLIGHRTHTTAAELCYLYGVNPWPAMMAAVPALAVAAGLRRVCWPPDTLYDREPPVPAAPPEPK